MVSSRADHFCFDKMFDRFDFFSKLKSNGFFQKDAGRVNRKGMDIFLISFCQCSRFIDYLKMSRLYIGKL